MQIKTVIFTGILLLALRFELYKIPLTSTAPYFIFPWSENGQLAKTDPMSLNLHLITALLLLIVSYVRYLYPKSTPVVITHAVIHIAFSAILFPMLKNFGDASELVAFAINGGLLYVLFAVYIVRDADIYFMVLSIPILFEVGLYTKHAIFPEIMIWIDVLEFFFSGKAM